MSAAPFGSDNPEQLALKRARMACVVRCVLAFGLTALASAQRLEVATRPTGVSALIGYCLFSLAALNVVYLRPGTARLQTRVGVVADLVAMVLLQSVSGGVRGGLVALFFAPLVTSSLLLERSFALLIAAVASIAIVGDTVVRDLLSLGEVAYFESGLLGATMFVVALVLTQLAQRVRSQESLVAATAAELNAQFRVNATVIEAMSQGVLIIGRDAHIQLSNPAARRLLGRELAALEGRTAMSNGGHWWELATLLQTWVRNQARGLPPAVMLTLPPDDEAPGAGPRKLRLRPVGLGGAIGTGDAPLVIYIEDLAETETQASQLKLASMGRLTASIAHEIRNPLAAIAHANALLRESADPIDARLHDIVGDNARRIDRIVEDILSVSQSTRIEPETLRLRDAIDTAVAELLPGGPEARARVSIDVPADATLRFDRMHFGRIVGNLLANALRHASATPGAIAVQLRLGAGGGSVLLVADDGEGVAPEHLRKLFEPFFTTHRKGTGLGLYLSRELASANGATLVLQSPGGGQGRHRGACFALRLPAALAQEAS
ncbi:sensor histidine kinase [Derxia gummosa]|uniref:histidine kinase n=1 Tax=Derxia gummosa DSM 723 TaxID=1121388 RepID=A0A8B6XB26_9BURK|nr:PAS domain-containing sensor histidine kinase [Derxia gummosa]